MKDEFKLKNYSTTISVEKTITQIEQILRLFGATEIMKSYLADGSINYLAFRIGESGYKLPANSEGILNILYSGKKQFNTEAQQQQAERVAWRIIKDWIHSQLSIIQSGQAQPDQVLLPYLFNGNQTFYEAYKSGQLQLPAKEETTIEYLKEGKEEQGK